MSKSLMNEQLQLLQKIQLCGVNLVCCGNCGELFLIESRAKKITCPYCHTEMEPSDCSDYVY